MCVHLVEPQVKEGKSCCPGYASGAFNFFSEE